MAISTNLWWSGVNIWSSNWTNLGFWWCKTTGSMRDCGSKHLGFPWAAGSSPQRFWCFALGQTQIGNESKFRILSDCQSLMTLSEFVEFQHPSLKKPFLIHQTHRRCTIWVCGIITSDHRRFSNIHSWFFSLLRSHWSRWISSLQRLKHPKTQTNDRDSHDGLL